MSIRPHFNTNKLNVPEQSLDRNDLGSTWLDIMCHESLLSRKGKPQVYSRLLQQVSQDTTSDDVACRRSQSIMYRRSRHRTYSDRHRVGSR